MSTPIRIVIGIFIILHGLVHPIMALVPQPMEEQSEVNPPVLGGFWTTSWLFGEGYSVKTMIYILSVITSIALMAAGIGFIKPYSWAIITWLTGAGLSLLSLIVFWNVYFILGIVIDVVMIVAVFSTSWLTS